MEPCETHNLQSKIGFYIARNIYDPNGGNLILKTNAIINNSIIEALLRRNINTVLISDTPIDVIESHDDSKDMAEVTKIKNTLIHTFDNVRKDIVSQLRFKDIKKTDIATKILKQVSDTLERIIEKIINNPTTIIYLSLIDENDPYLLHHSANVAYLMVNMVTRYQEIRSMLRCPKRGVKRFSTGDYVNPSDIVPLGMSGLLHDIGKILMQEIINQDVRYSNDDQAWEKIKQHPKVGHDILFGKHIDAACLLGIKYHHENWDGSGYPYGIKEYKIHPYARIIRIVDSFDAATSDRPGHKAMQAHKIIEEMYKLANIHYDKEILEIFKDMVVYNAMIIT